MALSLPLGITPQQMISALAPILMSKDSSRLIRTACLISTGSPLRGCT